MASRGSIPQLLRAAGIDLLRPEQGIPVLRDELASLSAYRELVVAHGLGDLLAERDPRGALDFAAVDARAAQAGPMTGGVVSFGLHDGLTVRAQLDPAREPFLDDHRIDGTPVLPGVMGIEAFAEAAALLWPDRPVLTIEQVEFLAPFKFFRDEPREVEIRALARADGEQTVVDCRLFGSRRLPGQEDAQRTLHFAGRVRLGARGAVAPPGDEVRSEAALRAVVEGGPALDAESIYRVYFHGPAYRVLAAVRRVGRGLVGEMPVALPAEASAATRFAPRAIELAFQTAGIADLAERGRLALPWRVERISFHGAGELSGGWQAELTPDGELGARARVFDAAGRLRLRVEGYRTVDLPGEIDPALAAPWRALAEVGA